MARQITQETFNDVVVENIKEFGMLPEDAVKDAVEQFELQGINLKFIIRDPKLFTKDGLNEKTSVKDEFEGELKSFQELFEPEKLKTSTRILHSCLTLCNKLKQIGSKGIPERCVATEVGFYTIFLKCLKNLIRNQPVPDIHEVHDIPEVHDVPEVHDIPEVHEVPDSTNRVSILKLGDENVVVLNELLCTFDVLVESQPDVMDDEGMEFFMSMLECCKVDFNVDLNVEVVKIIENLLKIFSKFCFMHESNRQKLVKAGLATNVVAILKISERKLENSGGEEGRVRVAVKEGCLVLESLVLDDDMRVPFGRSHDHAIVINNQCHALPLLFNLLKKFIGDKEVSSQILSTIGRLVVREEFCVSVSEMGGVCVVMEMVKQHLSDNEKHVLKNTLQLLKNLSGCDKVKVEVMTYPDGSGVLCEVIERNIKDASICDVACTLIASLVLRYPDHGRKFVEENKVHDLIRRLMIVHDKVPNVQKSSSMAIRNIVSRSPDLQTPFLEVGIEELLRRALRKHEKTCRDEISYALRDLNCDVQLRELWKGTGKTLGQ